MDNKEERKLLLLKDKIKKLQDELKREKCKDSLLELADFTRDEPLSDKFKENYDISRLGIYYALEFYYVDLRKLKYQKK